MFNKLITIFAVAAFSAMAQTSTPDAPPANITGDYIRICGDRPSTNLHRCVFVSADLVAALDAFVADQKVQSGFDATSGQPISGPKFTDILDWTMKATMSQVVMPVLQNPQYATPEMKAADAALKAAAAQAAAAKAAAMQNKVVVQ